MLRGRRRAGGVAAVLGRGLGRRAGRPILTVLAPQIAAGTLARIRIIRLLLRRGVLGIALQATAQQYRARGGREA